MEDKFEDVCENFASIIKSEAATFIPVDARLRWVKMFEECAKGNDISKDIDKELALNQVLHKVNQEHHMFTGKPFSKAKLIFRKLFEN
jgi:hypothetical protein